MLRTKTDEKNPAHWFAMAAERLRGADVLWTHEGLTGLGIEALHEAAERYLKGYLIARGWSLKKTHDLEALIKDGLSYDPAFGQFVTMAGELTEDFIAQHYPGEEMIDTGQNYEELRAQVGQMIELIQGSLPQFFPTLPASS
ncbi:MAG: HEPN domain-containing protein [Verrucomicrobia bacterium]|nr:HEPN domain-containing protein [Verrucomicrobiota bacterium]